MRKALLLGALAVIVTALLIVPLPLFVIAPGQALSVTDRVDLDHAEDEPSGRLLLTTVRVGQPSIVGAFWASVDGDQDLVPRQQIVPRGVDDTEYFRAQQRLFTESTRIAAAVGLRAAGFDAEVSGSGAQVAAVLPGSPADGRLREGDVIVAVDDSPIKVASDLMAATARASAGDVTTLTILRGDDRITVELTLDEVTEVGRPGIGVAVRTLDRQIVLPFDVEIDGGEIGGPSAGLMVALTVYELAEDGDLAQGRSIAGTGTIDATGRVGAVGGVGQKVAAAVSAGVDVFLAPGTEAATARKAAGGRVRVLAVESLDDAITALEEAA